MPTRLFNVCKILAVAGTMAAYLPAQVINAPTLAKAFGSASIPLGGTTTLTFTIGNTNTFTLNGIAFSDTLPGGLLVATPNGLVNNCAGSTVTATAGSNSFTLSALSLPPGTCTVQISVVGVAPGEQDNVTSAITATLAPDGLPALAGVVVIAPPTIAKSFDNTMLLLGGTANLTLTISNPNNFAALTNVGVSDTLPAGLILSTPALLATTCTGGVLTGVAGGTTFGVSGATLLASGTCTVTVSVTGTTLGLKINITSVVVSSNGGNGPVATASIQVVPPDSFLISYAANLNIADAFVNATNGGTVGGFDFGDILGRPAGGICVNAYFFDPNEEELSCCSCYISPNGLHSFSLQSDFLQNLLTPGSETAGVVKLLATTAVDPTCTNTAATVALDGSTLEGGLRAWMARAHNNTSVGPTAYELTENQFWAALLSPSELQKMTALCGTIITNGSKHGVCNSCPSQGLAAAKQ